MNNLILWIYYFQSYCSNEA